MCPGFAATPIPTSVTQSLIRLHHSAGHRLDPLQHNTEIPLSMKTNAKNYTKLKFHVLPYDTGPSSSIPTTNHEARPEATHTSGKVEVGGCKLMMIIVITVMTKSHDLNKAFILLSEPTNFCVPTLPCRATGH
jgi:hypothetical protein